MRSAAVIVGIDRYAQYPLTSCVNDAVAFRDALVRLGLVAAADTRILTSPPVAGGPPAVRSNITAALLPFYQDPQKVDRLYFYFAGHGLLTYSDAAHTQASTVLVPEDVTDLKNQGNLLINLDELANLFRRRGPAEQFFFIDACRDIPERDFTSIGPLGWTGLQPGPERAQAVLFAVAEQGQARSQQQGMGVMSRHLLDALDGQGLARDFSDKDSQYVVTAQSLRDYVRQRVLETLSTMPLWKQQYSLPLLRDPDPKPGPIRMLPQPGVSQLTVHVIPDVAWNQTDVSVWLRIAKLPISWPPTLNHRPATVEPQRYTVRATSAAGQAEPEQQFVDARENGEATIRIGTQPFTAASPVEDGIAPAMVRSVPRPDPPPTSDDGPTGTMVASTREPEVGIEIVRLDPPYSRYTARHEMTADLPVGPYRVTFKLGDEVISQADTFVGENEVVTAEPTVSVSPLAQELLQSGRESTAVQVSESIGPIQADVLGTVLPIIGIKPFDLKHELFGQFEGVVPPVDPLVYRMRPLSLVVAIDGNQWSSPPSQVLDRVTWRIRTANPAREKLLPLLSDNPGFRRIGLGLAPAPRGSFQVEIESPDFGRLLVPCAGLPKRATVVSMRVHPDGSLDLAQNILPLPGVPTDMPVPQPTYGRMLRDLQLGQKLFQSGQLAEYADRGPFDNLGELFYAKWTDPILSCMAYFAWQQAIAAHQPGAPAGAGLLRDMAYNLREYFGDLPDSRVIYAAEYQEPSQLDFLLGRKEVPVLASSARALARYAQQIGRETASIVSIAHNAGIGPWAASWKLPSLTVAKPGGGKKTTRGEEERVPVGAR